MAKKTSRKSVRRAAPKKKKTAPKARGVLVVNMIPRGLSGESNQDTEPMIAVNTAILCRLQARRLRPIQAGQSGANLHFSRRRAG